VLHHDKSECPDDAVEGLRKTSPELATLFDALRAEFDAKLSSLKAWGVAMCLGGGAVGGFAASLTEITRPGTVASAVQMVERLLG
jgi:hypothetical protein